MAKIGGICGECGKYYRGEVCPNDHISVSSGHTLHVINDIPEHYNRGLGKVVRGRRDYQAAVKSAGLIEVGNERNYVSQAHNEKLQERKTEAMMSTSRSQAYEMIRSDPTWN